VTRELACKTCLGIDQSRFKVPESCDFCDAKIAYDEKSSKISRSNEQIMQSLWHDYHNQSIKRYELLYYDRK